MAQRRLVGHDESVLENASPALFRPIPQHPPTRLRLVEKTISVLGELRKAEIRRRRCYQHVRGLERGERTALDQQLLFELTVRRRVQPCRDPEGGAGDTHV